jgi:hypothetical protein
MFMCWIFFRKVGTSSLSFFLSFCLPSFLLSLLLSCMLSYPRNRPWRAIGLWDFEVPIFSLDSRLTDGSKFVSLTRRPPFTPQKDSWYSVLLEAESTPGLCVRLEELDILKKVHLIGTWTRDLPACSIAPQPTTLPRVLPFFLYVPTVNFSMEFSHCYEAGSVT